MLHYSCFIFQKSILFHDFVFFSSNNVFFINCVLKFQYQPGHLKNNVTPGYFMYMFVHIRKMFPKNVFITHHFFFGKLHLWLEKFGDMLVQFGDWYSCSCCYCNWSITQPVATRFCHVVHCLIENLPGIIMLMTYVLVLSLESGAEYKMLQLWLKSSASSLPETLLFFTKEKEMCDY